jgi:murein DD-endopeptidase MepM/ murein hydrolase activator NlpD
MNKIIDGTINVLVGIDEHPKVAKGGNYAADIATKPGQPVYAPADGKIPHVLPDALDGGTKTSTFFTIDLTKAQKSPGVPSANVVFAHLTREDKGRELVKAGDIIGYASGTSLHVGCNNRAVLEAILQA